MVPTSAPSCRDRLEPMGRQLFAGFTIVEVLIASTLFLLLSLVLFQILFHAQYMSEVMMTKFTLQGQAREIFQTLSFGGVTPGGDPATPANRITGYHGRAQNSPPGGADLRLVNRRLFLTDTNNGSPVAIQSRQFLPATTITCIGLHAPIEACASTEDQILDGYVDKFESKSDVRNIDNRTPELTFTVIDPHKIRKNDAEPFFTQKEYSETYWTVFTLNRDM